MGIGVGFKVCVYSFHCIWFSNLVNCSLFFYKSWDIGLHPANFQSQVDSTGLPVRNSASTDLWWGAPSLPAQGDKPAPLASALPACFAQIPGSLHS